MKSTAARADGLVIKFERADAVEDIMTKAGGPRHRSSSRRERGAHRRGGREALLARGGIREHDAFLGHEMKGPAGTGRGGVSMAGGREGQSARKGNGVKQLRPIGAEMV